MGRTAAARGHEILAHTADAGLRTWAPDLPALFEEAAAALGELAADVAPGAPVDEIPLELAAADLVGLAYAWLNELIGLVDSRASAIARARVESVAVEPVAAGPAKPDSLPGAPGQRPVGRPDERPIEQSLVLRATVGLVRCGRRARPRLEVKSATYHRLAVQPGPGGGWTLTAYLDV